MIAIFEKIKTSIFPRVFSKTKTPETIHLNPNFQYEPYFPKGHHVFGITRGPGGSIIVGAGDPASAEGSVFVRQPTSQWKQISLPDETAWLSRFLRLKNGNYVASGMSLLGRAAILTGDQNLENWKSIDMDLHPFCQINMLLQAANGDLLAATGQMITQGKTKPIVLRSKDQGLTWEKEEIKLPITQFHTLCLDGERIYAGTCGDHDPMLYYSDDHGTTWQDLPKLPSYKTYKTIALQPIMVKGKKCLLAMMWGYKLDIADRIVRLYVSDEAQTMWSELPPLLDSHFIFSFQVTSDQTFYAGSEKGMILQSTDLGRSWNMIEKFKTNIGAYSIYDHGNGEIWFGKDFVQPNHSSLWKYKNPAKK